MTFFRPRLTDLERRDTPSTFQEVEPNDFAFSPNDITIATGAILSVADSDWLTIQASIVAGGDRDYFRFNLPSPSGVFLNLNSRDTGLSTTLDAVVDIYDASGTTLLGTNDQGYDFDNFIAPVASVASATSPDPALYVDLGPGTYIVRVMSFQSASSGAYELRMLADSGYSSSVPALESRPGAPVSFFLDFNGHSATDNWGTYTASPFNLSGSSSTFSAGEEYAIHNIWRVVSEDFSPFNMNVTTIEPPDFADGIAYRVVLTGSAGTVVGQSATARGAAIFGSFGGTGINTGFVFQPGFTDYQGGISGSMVAAALEEGNEASRQLGSALGMRHYGGVNVQPSGIMQIPDTGINRSTWSKGLTHSGEPPVVMQDDVTVVTSPQNGITYATDDHGDTISTATPIVGTSITGVVAGATDRDMFSFVAPQGNAIINVTGDAYSGDSDLELRVYNQAGQIMVTATPNNSFDAGTIAYVSTPGTYYAEVRCSNSAGAFGNYRVDLSFAPVTGPGQVLATTLNDGVSSQRSMVNRLELRFSRPMSFPNGPSAAFIVTGINGPTPIDIDLSNSTPSYTVAVIRFPIAGGGFGSIADGSYHLTVVAANALDDTNEPLDGDSDGQAGGNYVYSFFRLYGDSDGNGLVDGIDFANFRAAFTTNSFAFDSDGNGVVDGLDFGQFRARFAQSVP